MILAGNDNDEWWVRPAFGIDALNYGKPFLISWLGSPTSISALVTAMRVWYCGDRYF